MGNIITRKISLRVVSEDKEEKDNIWKQIRDISFDVSKGYNEVMTSMYVKDSLVHDLVTQSVKPTELRKMTDKEKKSLYKDVNERVKDISSNTTLYRQLAYKYPNIPTNCVPSLVKQGMAKYAAMFKELKSGNKSLPSFNSSTPIPTPKKYLEVQKDYSFRWFNGIFLQMYFGRDRSGNKDVVDHIFSGKYKLCDSAIQLKNNKLFLLLSVDIPVIDVGVDPDIVVGVDLGITYAAVCAINGSREKMFVSEGVIEPKKRIQAQRRSLQKSLKYTKGGKGRNKKLAALERLRSKESNTTQTINHTISKHIVDFALKNQAGTIRLEDLSGITRELSNTFVLKNWTYFQLQTMIEYKSKKYGIVVEKVEPAYTSQVCSHCGTKGKRVSQKDFVCQNESCDENDKKHNADLNAALNIAKGGVVKAHNKETKVYFASLDYGQAVLPEPEVSKKTHSGSTFSVGMV